MELTPKQTAQKTVEKYIPFCAMEMTEIQCALIEVNAIIELLYSLKFGNALSEEIEYYEEVKQELMKSE